MFVCVLSYMGGVYYVNISVFTYSHNLANFVNMEMTNIQLYE